MQKPVAKQERESGAWGTGYPGPSISTWHPGHSSIDCDDCRPAGHPGVLGPTERLSEPCVAKNAELWPTEVIL